MNSNNLDEWVHSFNQHLKLKSFEQFSLLLCDPTSIHCDIKQKELLSLILFHDPKSPDHWNSYVEYCIEKFPDKKLQLQRLMNKAIEVIDEKVHVDNDQYIQLLIHSALLKKDAKDISKQFQSFWKRNIGRKSASMYLKWASNEKSINGVSGSIDVLQKGLLCNAEPRHLIKSQLLAINNELHSNKASSTSSSASPTTDTTITTVINEVVPSNNDQSINESSGRKLRSIQKRDINVMKKVPVVAPKPLLPLKSNTAGSLGRCQRVSKTQQSESQDQEDQRHDHNSYTDISINYTQSTSVPIASISSYSSNVISSTMSTNKSDIILPLIKSSKRKPSILSKCELTTGLGRVSEEFDDDGDDDDLEENDDAHGGGRTIEISVHLDNDNKDNKDNSSNNSSPPTIVLKNTFVDVDNIIAESQQSMVEDSDEDDTTMLNNTLPLPTLSELILEQNQNQNQHQKQLKSNPTAVVEDRMSQSISKHTKSVSFSKNSGDSNDTKDNKGNNNKNSKRKRSSDETNDVIVFQSNSNTSKRMKFDSKSIVKDSLSSSSDSSGNDTIPIEKKVVNNKNNHTNRSSIGEDDITSRLITVNGKRYHRLSVLGKGGSSTVYRVVSDDYQKIYAYKRVDIKSIGGEEQNTLFDNYVNEIELLRRLKGSNSIIELIDAEINRDDMYIAMIMEAGDSDLAKVLSQRWKDHKPPSSVGDSNNSSHNKTVSTMNPFFIRLVWQEMLEAVDDIHNHRIVHGDLKPANFVFVKGHLKLIDFGIAKTISNDTTNIYRESQIGTVNYMAPEAISPTIDSKSPNNDSSSLLDHSHSINNNNNSDNSQHKNNNQGNLRMRLGRASDIWSLGCILYQIIYGRPPFAHLNTIQKLHAIPNPKYDISYPEHNDQDAIEVIKLCLQRDPKSRSTIRGDKENAEGLLDHRFLQPYPSNNDHNHDRGCDSISSLNEIKIKQTIDRILSEKGYHSSTATELSRQVLNSMLSSSSLSSSCSSSTGTTKGKTTRTLKRDRDSLQSSSSSSTDGSTETVSLTTKLSTSLTRKPSQSMEDTENVIILSNQRHNNTRQNKVSKRDSTSSIELKPLSTIKAERRVLREPLRTLPVTLQDAIHNKASELQSAQSSSRAKRWMKPKSSPVKEDMRSELERRIGLIRQFIDTDQDNMTSQDFTEGNSFF